MEKLSYKGGDLENRIRNKKEVFKLVSINRYDLNFIKRVECKLLD
jgi:hypothetical protein